MDVRDNMKFRNLRKALESDISAKQSKPASEEMIKFTKRIRKYQRGLRKTEAKSQDHGQIKRNRKQTTALKISWKCFRILKL